VNRGDQFMNDFIFEHYVSVAWPAIAIVLPLMLVAVLFTRRTGRLKAVAVALVTYLAIVVLGMSSDIKHLSLIGVAHALIAFGIAALAVEYLKVWAGWLLFVPCFFIAIVVIFNIVNQGMGLELMGRWIASG